ncbi:TIGR00730 family Rossman fold protein [Flavihumibacter sp. UBA7668]|uniref:LOG family protein n=1 Tax=Flavihumibacter sp. UBA7668 TaxID=1946542 RepID=UPI0025B80919|nr:TIGR00730 family Rossman fold protein [Flavihumibacter sp. UBA7668]
MKSITVFCGSSSGSNPVYLQQARLLGEKLAEAHIELIYGGAKVGLMGAVADGALSKRGKVTGILPRFLQSKEIAHENLSELILVESMHERKTIMHHRSEGVIALPGGFGTLEEFFEMLTWAQLGLHSKPIGILNTDGFYNSLLVLVQEMVDKGFLKKINQQMILQSEDIELLLEKMNHYKAPAVTKWITTENV